MSCLQTISDYAFRSIGYGPRLLPKSDITLCEQVTLIGSGMLWNIYFGVLALAFGFVFATLLAVAKNTPNPWLRKPAEWFIFLFRGSPLFIQFFLAYELFVQLPKAALVVLFLNTSAYSAEIFYGALRSVPKGDMEAADAYGMVGWKRFRRITWPTMLRLAWPSFTNEAIFLFHATALVFFSGFPAWQQKGDALYYASYFAEKTFNPFVPYPIVAGYFVALIVIVIVIFNTINMRLNRHMPKERRPKLRFKPQIIR